MAQILIDLRWMVPGYTGGLEIVAREFVQTLLKYQTDHQFTLLLPQVTRYDFNLQPDFQLHICDGPGSYLDKLIWRFRKIYTRLRGSDLDSVWVNGQQVDFDAAISPAGFIQEDLYPLRNLLIVHDLQHEQFPEFFTTEEYQARRRIIGKSVQQADRVVTISNFTRQCVIEKFQLPEDKVSVAYEAAAPLFQQPVQDLDQVLEKYNLEQGGYLFYPANTWPHKNHKTVLAALKLLHEGDQKELLFVCTGAPKEAHQDILLQVQELGLQDYFRFLGYCPRNELPALYRGAAVLVFPSLFEGFGLPVLEAMWCGCPVICSHTTSLPEVAGDAALYVDPLDANALAEAIYKILTDEHLRSDLIQKGYQQAQKFSWEKFLGKILEVLDRMLGISEHNQSSHQDDIEKLIPRDVMKTQSRRVRRSHELIKQAAEYDRLGKHREAWTRLIPGIFLGPDVAFNLLWFPYFRDRFLRRLLAKFSL